MESTPPLARQTRKTRAPWIAYLWPGLAHLWVEGSWAGLALAIGFTALVNLAIVNLFIWPELLDVRAKWVGGVALLLLWLAALWETRGELRRQAERRRAESEGTLDPETERLEQLQAEADRQLMTAQRQYLAGDWVEAERTLVELVRNHKQDIEAHLMLATLWRHLGRTTQAKRRLHKIARLEAADPWRFEIENELAILQTDQTNRSEDLPPNTIEAA